MSGGAGQTPAGVGPAGYDPISPATPTTAREPSTAVRYEPRTRDFAGSDGVYDAIHPVDQFVALNLTIKRGAIKSAPNVGATYWQILRIDKLTVQADVEARTREALAPVLASPPKVEIIAIETDVSVRSQLKIAVTYRNLVTGLVRSARILVPMS